MSKNLLHITKLEAFKMWLNATGREHRPGRGDYQALQIKYGSGWCCIYTKNHMPEHFTVDIRIESLVRAFIAQDKTTGTIPESVPSVENKEPESFDEDGPSFDSGWK